MEQRQNTRTQQTRERLRAAAHRLFLQQGYLATSIDAILTKDYVFQTPVFLDREIALRQLPAFFRFALGRNKEHQFVKLADKPVA